MEETSNQGTETPEVKGDDSSSPTSLSLDNLEKEISRLNELTQKQSELISKLRKIEEKGQSLNDIVAAELAQLVAQIPESHKSLIDEFSDFSTARKFAAIKKLAGVAGAVQIAPEKSKINEAIAPAKSTSNGKSPYLTELDELKTKSGNVVSVADAMAVAKKYLNR